MGQKTTNVLVDLAGASINTDFGGGLLWQKTGLSANTMMQNIIFDYKVDPTKPEMYLVQCENGSSDGGSKAGELVVNHMNYAGTAITAAMKLLHNHSDIAARMDGIATFREVGGRGFGSGTQGAIEYTVEKIPNATNPSQLDSLSETYLWLDCGSPVINRTLTSDKAEFDVTGNHLCRIKFNAGSTARPNDVTVQELSVKRLFEKSDFGAQVSRATVSIDNVYKRLAFKYLDENTGEMKVSIFQMDYSNYKNHVSEINFIPLSTFKVPTKSWWKANSDGTCSSTKAYLYASGFTIFGDYIYFGYGSAYWAPTGSNFGQQDVFSPSTASGTYGDGTAITMVGNTHLRCYDWTKVNTNGDMILVKEVMTEAGKSMTHREIQGMHAIPTVDENGNVTKLRVMFTFSGGMVGARTWSVFEKENSNIPLE